MWSKNACRVSSAFRLSSLKYTSRGTRCCCAQRASVNGTGSHSRSPYTTTSHDQSGHSSGGRVPHAGAIACTSLALSAYVLWRDKNKVYAAEEETTTQKSGSTDGTDIPENEDVSNNAEDLTQGLGDDETDPLDDDVAWDSKSTSATESAPIDWSTVPDIPAHVPYLLIGGGVACLEAYKTIKTRDVDAKVLMISEEDYPPYWRPPLSKHFWFDDDLESYKQFEYTNMRGKKSSVFLSPGLYKEPKKIPFSKHGGLGYLQNTKVVKLDAENKKVTLEDGTEISFDKCLIATGARPRNVEVLERAGTDVRERTTLFRNLKDMWKLMEATKSAKSIAVIGGGFLGSELAVGLAYRGEKSGVKVHQIFPEKGNMAKVLPVYLSQWTTEQVKADGVNVISGANVKTAIFDDRRIHLRLTTGQVIKVDHVVVAVGVVANTDLAESAELELDDKYGGIRVNTELQARSDIWAAGDCACFYDAKLGRRRVEHFDHAEITGRLAGYNMTGEAKPYTHQSMFWSTLGTGVDYEAVGLVDSKLDSFSVFRKPSDKEANNSATPKAEKKTDASKTKSDKPYTVENYDHGVVFYLKNDEIVGVVLWNLSGFKGSPSRIDIARQIVADGAKGKDLTEVAKLFNIYAN